MWCRRKHTLQEVINMIFSKLRPALEPVSAYIHASPRTTYILKCMHAYLNLFLCSCRIVWLFTHLRWKNTVYLFAFTCYPSMLLFDRCALMSCIFFNLDTWYSCKFLYVKNITQNSEGNGLFWSVEKKNIRFCLSVCCTFWTSLPMKACTK